MVSSAWAGRGLKPIEVLADIFDDGPLPVQTIYSRMNAAAVAACASAGLLTSLDSNGTPTRQWRLTRAGLVALSWADLEEAAA